MRDIRNLNISRAVCCSAVITTRGRRIIPDRKIFSAIIRLCAIVNEISIIKEGPQVRGGTYTIHMMATLGKDTELLGI